MGRSSVLAGSCRLNSTKAFCTRNCMILMKTYHRQSSHCVNNSINLSCHTLCGVTLQGTAVTSVQTNVMKHCTGAKLVYIRLALHKPGAPGTSLCTVHTCCYATTVAHRVGGLHCSVSAPTTPTAATPAATRPATAPAAATAPTATAPASATPATAAPAASSAATKPAATPATTAFTHAATAKPLPIPVCISAPASAPAPAAPAARRHKAELPAAAHPLPRALAAARRLCCHARSQRL